MSDLFWNENQKSCFMYARLWSSGVSRNILFITWCFHSILMELFFSNAHYKWVLNQQKYLCLKVANVMMIICNFGSWIILINDVMNIHIIMSVSDTWFVALIAIAMCLGFRSGQVIKKMKISKWSRVWVYSETHLAKKSLSGTS